MEKIEYSLGIDLGTTSVKMVIINKSGGEIISSDTHETKANINVGDSKKSEQSISKIFNAINYLLENIEKEVKEKIKYIGISGQMHGVVMWMKEPHEWTSDGKINILEKNTTNLITWQDQRCDKIFLEGLPDTGYVDKLNSGFGLPTLIWLQKYEYELFIKFKYCGTIQDLLVAILTGNTLNPIITDQNASSWGFYNTDNKTWKTNLLNQIGFPIEILPTIKDAELKAGKLVNYWSHIPKGCTVGAAAGDLETSVLSILHGKNPSNCAIINISTSIQLTFLLPINFKLEQHEVNYENSNVEYRPYFGNRLLAVGAGLNGGNFLAFLVSTLKSWLEKFGNPISDDEIWKLLLSEGSNKKSTDLIIEPTLLGERHCPNKKASITNIQLSNFDLGDIMRSSCRGMITSLQELLPKEMLIKYGINKIYATGSALIRNKILQEEIQRQYKEFTIEVCNAGDAAFGAAVMGQNAQ